MITINELQKVCDNKFGPGLVISEYADKRGTYWQLEIFDGDADGYVGVANIDINNFDIETPNGRLELGSMYFDHCALSEYIYLINEAEELPNTVEDAVKILLNKLSAQELFDKLIEIIYTEIDEHLSWWKTTSDYLKG